jgi:hypothetical protein
LGLSFHERNKILRLSTSDLIPIIREVRKKYNLPEISLDDDPIEEIYLGDRIIPLEEFRQDFVYLSLVYKLGT